MRVAAPAGAEAGCVCWWAVFEDAVGFKAHIPHRQLKQDCPVHGSPEWAVPWRLGSHYQIHVYAGERPVATFHTVEDARRCVSAVRAAAGGQCEERLEEVDGGSLWCAREFGHRGPHSPDRHPDAESMTWALAQLPPVPGDEPKDYQSALLLLKASLAEVTRLSSIVDTVTALCDDLAEGEAVWVTLLRQALAGIDVTADL
jgi:hypothetical protein